MALHAMPTLLIGLVFRQTMCVQHRRGPLKMRLAAVVRVCVGLSLAAATTTASAQYGPPSPMSDPLSRVVSMQRKQLGTTSVDQQRLAAAASHLAPERKGVVDAYVIVVALDSDPVFAREARETARVLTQRYDAAGRTLLLAGLDGRSIDPQPKGSPDTLGQAIKQVAGIMNTEEDALILYITAHGSPQGIAWRDQGQMLGNVAPEWLDDLFKHYRIANRLVMVSACFSGIFVPVLRSEAGAVITAASADRTSFGCQSDNDWTFFGDALINHGLRKAQPLASAFGEAKGMIGGWEAKGKLIPSNPQIAIGPQAGTWLGPLETRMPKLASAPVGRPAIDSLDKAIAANH